MLFVVETNRRKSRLVSMRMERNRYYACKSKETKEKFYLAMKIQSNGLEKHMIMIHLKKLVMLSHIFFSFQIYTITSPCPLSHVIM